MHSKIKEWVRRYLPAEVISVAATILSALLCFYLTGSRLTTALVGTWIGNIGYFGYIILFDVYTTRRQLRQQGRTYTRRTLLANLKALAVEFGIAELLDSLLIRPALMYYMPIWLGSMALGTLVAKIAADVTFYIPAIIGYEITKRKMRNFTL